MTSGSLPFQADPRSVLGRRVRAMRKQGLTPAHVYGRALDPTNIQADSEQLARLVSQAGTNTPVALSVTGSRESLFTFIREVQRHPVTEAILHVDFLQVSMTERMQAAVPITLVGESDAVRVLGGMLFQALEAVQVECLPLDLPQSVEVDISALDDFEKTLTVASLSLGDSVTLLSDPSELVARINAPRVADETADIPEGEAVIEAPTTGQPSSGDPSPDSEEPS